MPVTRAPLYSQEVTSRRLTHSMPPEAHPTHLGPGQFLLNGSVAGLHMASKLEVVDGIFMATVYSLRKKPNP